MTKAEAPVLTAMTILVPHMDKRCAPHRMLPVACSSPASECRCLCATWPTMPGLRRNVLRTHKRHCSPRLQDVSPDLQGLQRGALPHIRACQEAKTNFQGLRRRS